MKKCLIWILMLLTVLLCACDADTAGKTTDGTNAVEWDGTYVYTSRLCSVPISANDESIKYYSSQNIGVNEKSIIDIYLAAADADSVYLSYYQDGYMRSSEPGIIMIDTETQEHTQQPMDARIEKGEFINTDDPAMLYTYIGHDGEDKFGAAKTFFDLFGMAVNGGGDRLMLYSGYRRYPNEDYDPFAYRVVIGDDGVERRAYSSSWYQSEAELTLAVYHPDGTLRYEIPVTEYLNDKNWTIQSPKSQSCIISDNGTVCLQLNQNLLFFDAEGNCFAQQELPVKDAWMSNVSLHRAPDDVIYLKLADEQSDTWKYCTVDMKTGSLGVLLDAPTASIADDVFFGVDSVLYTSDDINLYRHNAQGNKETLFDWMSVGIIGANVEQVYSFNEDRFAVVVFNTEIGMPEIVFIDYVRSDSVTPKTEIVIAAGNYTGQALKTLQTAVQLFNRKSEDYVVTVDYYDPAGSGMFNVNQQIANDMANGKQIDLIVFHEDITMEYFDNLGILGDWYPLMDADEVYTRDAFLPCIRAAYETPDGRLPVLTTDFSLTTLVGSTELIGDREYWTYAECLDFVNSLNWDQILLQLDKPKENTEPDAMLVLRSFLPMVLDDYIDEETGTCMLDSDSFIELLHLCESVIINHDQAAYKASQLGVVELIYEGEGFIGEYRGGHTMLYNQAGNYYHGANTIVHPSDVMNMLINYFKGHESLSFIGYPMPDTDSGSGTAVTPLLQFGLTASAAHIDGVWGFMREYLSYMETREQSDDYDNDNVYGLPCMYAALDALLDYYEGHTYLLDGGPNIRESSAIEDSYGYGGDRSPYIYDADPRVRGFLTALLQKTTRRYSGNSAVMDIIYEEASAYYGGIRTIEETVGIMQSRVGIWLAEHVG